MLPPWLQPPRAPLTLSPEGDFYFQPHALLGIAALLLPAEHGMPGPVCSPERGEAAAAPGEGQVPIGSKGVTEPPSPAGRGWRFHAGLSRWHSVSGVSTEPWDRSWVWFGLGLHKLCSLKSRSWAVSRAGRGLGAPSRCWGESAGSWHCQAGAFLFVVHFSPELAAFQQGHKNPKSFVNLEVRLLKSILSGLCRHYRARTEVQEPQMCRVGVLL